ncbi:sensor histidine kinase [Microbacterium telephonicum]|uniref:Sensor-like histidine kinase SenX3 n=1 Tax=Microbacterium telephonicum TaxID=1714841 RepID=A0A498C4N4_9MICO|nr:HAMP domain-containing sensor histidine kinase [Microbacterium telephonicum]RLK48000.1 PAS domain S-box-containing protein [Microbacterium telephonicum]
MSGEGEARISSRSRSIWLWQLVLTAAVVVLTLVLLVLSPDLLSTITIPLGIGMVIATTVVVMLVPWDRVSTRIVALIPFSGIVSIGALAWGSDLRMGFLWVFPLAWLATYYRIAWIGGLVLVAALIVLDAVTHQANTSASLRFTIVLLSLTFLAITINMESRKTGAATRLLRRQSARLEETIRRVRAQERRVNQMLNGLEAGIARVDRHGQLLAANDSYIALYGLDRRDLTQPGSSVEYDGHGGTALREAERPRARAARGERFTDERMWLFDAQGEWHTVNASTVDLVSGPGEPDVTMLIVTDVTAAEAAQQATRTMARTVSHELSNPLTAILGYTDLLLDDDALTDRQRERLELVEAAGQRMERLIADVLRAGGTAQPAEAPRRLVDLREVLTASAESFSPAARLGDVALEVAGGDPLPVMADAFRVRQVFDNLISNAVKYTPPTGEVSVTASADDREAVVVIRDSGIGIAADDLPLVFTDYFRAGTALESGTPGTGLGMGIARAIVEQHSGTLGIESTPGVGTTITLRMPLTDVTEADLGPTDTQQIRVVRGGDTKEST